MRLEEVRIPEAALCIGRSEAVGQQLAVAIEQRELQSYAARLVDPVGPGADVEPLWVRQVGRAHEPQRVIDARDRLTDALGRGLSQIAAIPLRARVDLAALL